MLLAFGTLTCLGIIGSGAVWLGFDAIETANRQVAEQALPALNATSNINTISTSLVKTLPSLEKATSEEEITIFSQNFESSRLQLNHYIEQLSQNSMQLQVSNAYRQNLDFLFQNITERQSLVRQYLDSEQEFAQKLDTSLEAISTIVELAKVMVENASTLSMASIVGIYDLVEEQEDEELIYQALDQVAEDNFDQLERMTELRVSANRVGQILNQLSRENNADNIAILKSDFENNWKALVRHLRRVEDPERKQLADQTFSTLASVTFEEQQNVFSLRSELTQITKELGVLSQQGDDLGRQITQQSDSVLTRSRDIIDQAIHDSESTLTNSRVILFGLGTVSLVTSILVLWFYIQRNLLKRIKGLQQKMTRLARGDLEVKVEDHDNDEISSMAATLEVFRQTALERLNLSRETLKANAELKRYRDELEELVQDRTVQLSQANDKLALEADRLKTARDLAQAADRAKSVFLATMSHEIRTPMNGVLGTAALLEDTELNQEQQKYVLTIAESGRILLHILNDILDYSKIEAGQLTIENVDFSLSSLVERLYNLLLPEAVNKGIEFAIDLDPDVPDILLGDPTRIQQILFNLIGNAIKFTQEGNVYIAIFGDQVKGQSSWKIRFEVSDTGIGIAADKKEKLFDAFAQAEQSTSRQYGGTGLGLSISKKLVDAMDGQMGVVSELEEGSTFWFELTLPVGSPQNVALEESDYRSTSPLKILLAEDIEVNRMVARAMLNKIGHEVIEAENGQQAIDLAISDKPDLIIMDINMLVVDGNEATRHIRNLDDADVKTIPILASSANVIGNKIQEMRITGFNGFLAKPFEPKDLQAAISDVMNNQFHIKNAIAEQTEKLFDQTILDFDTKHLGPEITQKLVQTFFKEASTLVEEINTALEQNIRSQKAHALKGASINVGLIKLSKKSSEIEHGEDTEGLNELYQDSVRELTTYYNSF